MARGFDSKRAKSIAARYTLSELKQLSGPATKAAGLTQREAELIADSGRPPIPSQTLHRVLFQNRFTCCVCRDPTQPVIVHHITEWSESKDHSAPNLCVLCLTDHARAHTKSTLSKNLDRTALRSFKSQWEEQVRISDAQAIDAASKLDGVNWSYVNLKHLYKILSDHKFEFNRYSYFRRLVSEGIIKPNGEFQFDKNTFWAYEGREILERFQYLQFLMSGLISVLRIDNISDHLTKGEALPIVYPQQDIFVQGAFYFRRDTKVDKGPGQMVTGYRQLNGIRIQFVFDSWEATSSSARSCWLSGRQSAGALIRVRSVEKTNEHILILGTVLAITYGGEILKTREYG